MAFNYRNLASLIPYGSLGPSPATVQRITPKASRSAPPRKPPIAPISPEQWAQQQAEKYIQARIDAIKSDRESYLKDLQEQSQLEAQRGQALSQALQALNLPGRIQQIYGNASADIGGLANAFSGSLRDTANADAANETRMVSGTGQEGAVANNGEAIGNVVYGLGGYIPGRSMSEAGAAFGAQAALEPSFAARIGQQNAAEAYREGLGGLDQFTKAMEDARGERFDIEQKLLGNRQKAITAQQTAAQKVSDADYKRLKDTRDYYVKQAYLALASGDRNRSNQYLQLAQEKEARMAAQAQGVDLNGNPLPGFKKGADGSIVKVAKGAGAKAKKARVAARQEREDEFRSARLDAIDEAKKLVQPATTLRPESRPSYQVAYQRLFNRYKDLLRFATGSGKAKLRARIDQMIREALLQNGWQEPGPGGGAGRRSRSSGSSFAGDR